MIAMFNDLNNTQVNRLSEFFGNMAVAWFVGAFINQNYIVELLRFALLGLFSLYASIKVLERGDLNA